MRGERREEFALTSVVSRGYPQEAPDASIAAGMEAGCGTNNMNCTQWLIWHSSDPPATEANASLVPDSIVGDQEGRAVWLPQWQVELDFFQIEGGGLS